MLRRGDGYIRIITTAIYEITGGEMRTTLTLDDDVASQLRCRAQGQHGGFKRVVNEVLRRGLESADKPSAQKPFILRARSCGFRPGIDPFRLNQALDDTDAEQFVLKHGNKVPPK